MNFRIVLVYLVAWICSAGIIHAQSGCLLVISDQQEDAHFVESTLPFLKELSKKQKLELQEIDASAGLPAEITTTPAIVFVNSKGTSIYTGRYTDHLRIKSFVRTARLLPQPDVINKRVGVPGITDGRSQTAAVIKVTPLQTEVSGQETKDWSAEIEEVIINGFQKLSVKDSMLLHKTDRTFFYDFHPYLSQDNQLYVSCALYSQFHCTIPVFENYAQPISTTYGDWKEAFDKAARLMEEQMFEIIASSKGGDAYRGIPSEVPTGSFSDVACVNEMAAGTVASTSIPEDLEIPQNWEQPSPIDEFSPMLQFNFVAPLDWYSGEVKQMSSEISFSPDLQLIKGNFVAELNTLTMGNEDLNTKIFKKYLKIYKYPQATFVMDSVQKHLPLKWGETASVQLYGQMTLLNRTHPVAVSATLTPFADAEGVPQVALSAQFGLNITDNYGIKGPESGPMESRKNMEFNLNCLLYPSPTDRSPLPDKR